MAQPWHRWLTDSLSSLRSADLLRTLRPVVPTLNAVEACPSAPHVDSASLQARRGAAHEGGSSAVNWLPTRAATVAVAGCQRV